MTSVPEHLEWHAVPPATGREILAHLGDSEVADLASLDVRGEAAIPSFRAAADPNWLGLYGLAWDAGAARVATSLVRTRNDEGAIDSHD